MKTKHLDYTNKSSILAILLISAVLNFISLLYRLFTRIMESYPGGRISYKSGKFVINDGEVSFSILEQIQLIDFTWQFIISFLIILTFFIVQKWSLKSFFGFQNAFRKENLIYFLISIVVISCTGFLIGDTDDEGVAFMKRLIQNNSLFSMILITGILIPILEEVYFRKFIYDLSNMFAKVWAPWIGIITSFILFILLHTQYSLTSLIFITVISAFLSYGRHYTKGIVIPILIHCTNNILAVLFS